MDAKSAKFDRSVKRCIVPSRYSANAARCAMRIIGVHTSPRFSLTPAIFLSLRRLRKTLRAMRPMAMMNVAAAATESPAIWAGFIVLGESAAAAGCTVGCVPVDVEVEEVGERVGDTESATTVSAVEGRGEGVLEVIVDLDVVVAAGRDDSIVVELVEVGGRTVTTVKVGDTALICPRQTLYASEVVLSEGQDVYMHPRATSPKDTPLKL